MKAYDDDNNNDNNNNNLIQLTGHSPRFTYGASHQLEYVSSHRFEFIHLCAFFLQGAFGLPGKQGSQGETGLIVGFLILYTRQQSIYSI